MVAVCFNHCPVGGLIPDNPALALGGIYSYLLSTSPLANVEITIICRGNYAIVSETGYTLTTNLWGNHTFHPHHVASSPSDLDGMSFDYIIVTTKAIPTTNGEKPALAEFPIQKNVPIILIQNGIGIEEPYRTAFPENPIISGVAYITASQPSPSHILHVGTFVRLILGLFDRPNAVDTEKMNYLVELFNSAQLPTAAQDDIQTERWNKLGWNGSYNVICAITGLDTAAYLATSPEAVELIREVIREISRTANAAGARVDEEELANRYIDWTYTGPSIIPSMLQDARNGVPMEIEVLCGNVWRIAEKLGVETPRIKYITPASVVLW